MRYYGIDRSIPVNPDTVVTVNVANAAQAVDYPANTDLVRVTFCSTSGAALAGVFNSNSTNAAWGSSASGTGGSSTANTLIPPGYGVMFNRARASTGFSVVMSSNGICSVECWSRTGNT